MLLPRPLPDEVVGSILARACHRHHVASGALLRALFGGEGKSVPFLLCGRLPVVAGACRISAEQLLWEHTVFPYAVSFMDSRLVAVYEKRLLSGDSGVGRFLKTFGAGLDVRRFCPHCVREDLAHYGESYWRRAHQLPGVFFCPDHGAYLRGTHAPLTGIRWSGEMPQDSAGRKLRLPTRRLLLRLIAVESRAHLTRRPFQPVSPAAQQRAAVFEKGYGSRDGAGATQQLNNDLHRYFGSKVLKAMGCDFHPASSNAWPSLIFREAGERLSTPRHVLLRVFVQAAESRRPSFSNRGQVTPAYLRESRGWMEVKPTAKLHGD